LSEEKRFSIRFNVKRRYPSVSGRWKSIAVVLSPGVYIQLFVVNEHTYTHTYIHTYIYLMSFIRVIYRVKQTYRKQEVSGV